MGCLLGFFTLILTIAKIVIMAVVKAVKAVASIFIMLKLFIPFLAASTLLLLWLFNVIEPGTALFLWLWIGFAALTVITVAFNIKNLRRKRQKKNKE